MIKAVLPFPLRPDATADSTALLVAAFVLEVCARVRVYFGVCTQGTSARARRPSPGA